MTKLHGLVVYIYKTENKITSTSNSYILISIKAFDFLFLSLHTESFLYGKIYFYKHSADVTRSDTSKPPYLQESSNRFKFGE